MSSIVVAPPLSAENNESINSVQETLSVSPIEETDSQPTESPNTSLDEPTSTSPPLLSTQFEPLQDPPSAPAPSTIDTTNTNSWSSLDGIPRSAWQTSASDGILQSSSFLPAANHQRASSTGPTLQGALSQSMESGLNRMASLPHQNGLHPIPQQQQGLQAAISGLSSAQQQLLQHHILQQQQKGAPSGGIQNGYGIPGVDNRAMANLQAAAQAAAYRQQSMMRQAMQQLPQQQQQQQNGAAAATAATTTTAQQTRLLQQALLGQVGGVNGAGNYLQQQQGGNAALLSALAGQQQQQQQRHQQQQGLNPATVAALLNGQLQNNPAALHALQAQQNLQSAQQQLLNQALRNSTMQQQQRIQHQHGAAGGMQVPGSNPHLQSEALIAMQRQNAGSGLRLPGSVSQEQLFAMTQLGLLNTNKPQQQQGSASGGGGGGATNTGSTATASGLTSQQQAALLNVLQANGQYSKGLNPNNNPAAGALQQQQQQQRLASQQQYIGANGQFVGAMQQQQQQQHGMLGRNTNTSSSTSNTNLHQQSLLAAALAHQQQQHQNVQLPQLMNRMSNGPSPSPLLPTPNTNGFGPRPGVVGSNPTANTITPGLNTNANISQNTNASCSDPIQTLQDIGKTLSQLGISVEAAVNAGLLGGLSASDVRIVAEAHKLAADAVLPPANASLGGGGTAPVANLNTMQGRPSAAVTFLAKQQQHRQQPAANTVGGNGIGMGLGGYSAFGTINGPGRGMEPFDNGFRATHPNPGAASMMLSGSGSGSALPPSSLHLPNNHLPPVAIAPSSSIAATTTATTTTTPNGLYPPNPSHSGILSAPNPSSPATSVGGASAASAPAFPARISSSLLNSPPRNGIVSARNSSVDDNEEVDRLLLEIEEESGNGSKTRSTMMGAGSDTDAMLQSKMQHHSADQFDASQYGFFGNDVTGGASSSSWDDTFLSGYLDSALSFEEGGAQHHSLNEIDISAHAMNGGVSSTTTTATHAMNGGPGTDKEMSMWGISSSQNDGKGSDPFGSHLASLSLGTGF